MRNYYEQPLEFGEKIPYDEIYDLYINQGLCRHELEKHFNVGRTKIYSTLREYKITKTSEQKAKAMERTFLKNYGTTNPRKNPEKNAEMIAKTKKTCLEKYGVDNVRKVEEINEKAKQAIINKYGTLGVAGLPEIQEKIRQTSQERYGVDYAAQAEFNKENHRKTNLEKYGCESFFQTEEFKEKSKETCMERYGVEYAMKNDEVKKKITQAFLEHYGVEHPMKLAEYREASFETAKRNNSFMKSQMEQNIFEKLQSRYEQIERQYSDERYPFRCDFYIPEEDLFIEIQGFAAHGKHPFDENSEQDRKLVEKWSQKAQEKRSNGQTKKQYNKFIHIWTITDPSKRKIAKENNLNWLEFFSEEEFTQWFEASSLSKAS